MSRNKKMLSFLIPFFFLSSFLIAAEQLEPGEKTPPTPSQPLVQPEFPGLFDAWKQSPQAKVMEAINQGSLERVQSLFLEGAFDSCEMLDVMSQVCRLNRAHILQFLLARGFSYDCGHSTDYTKPLQVAVLSGSTACVQIFMEFGAKNIKGNNSPYGQKDLPALARACLHFDLAVMIESVFKLMNQSNKVLFEAIEEGDLGKVIDAIALPGVSYETTNADGYNPLTCAASEGKQELVGYFLGQGIEPCLNLADKTKNVWAAAVCNNQWEVAQFLCNYFKNKPDSNFSIDQRVNAEGWTALHYAAYWQCDKSLFAWLFAEGIDPNIQTSSFLKETCGDSAFSYESGSTSISMVAHRNLEKVIPLFVEDPRVDLNLSNSFGTTALRSAIFNWRYEISELLCRESRTDLDYTPKSRSTVLWLLLNHLGDRLSEDKKRPYLIKFVKLLLDYGADPTIPNKDGQKPIAFLKSLRLKGRENKKLVRTILSFLEEAAARPSHQRAVLKRITRVVGEPVKDKIELVEVVGVPVSPKKVEARKVSAVSSAMYWRK